MPSGIVGGKSPLKTNSPAECQSQTIESMNHVAHALHGRSFSLTLSLPTMNVSPGRAGSNNGLRLPGQLIADTQSLGN